MTSFSPVHTIGERDRGSHSAAHTERWGKGRPGELAVEMLEQVGIKRASSAVQIIPML